MRNANRGDSQLFMRIDSHHNVRAVRASRIKPAICSFWCPEKRFVKKGVRFGNPDMIRTNQAIRTNLRIQSHESGHLREQCLQNMPFSFCLVERLVDNEGFEARHAISTLLQFRRAKSCEFIGT